jgi:ATP-dependent DNA helicase RecQ
LYNLFFDRPLAHDQLSTFGIGKDISEQQWLSLFRQLVTRGFLVVDWEAHGALRLADSCRPLLRGEQPLFLRRDEYSKAASSREPRRSGATAVRFTSPANEALWQDLRALRKRLAEEQEVPPYVILHDAVLVEMVQSRPQSRAQLAQIPGIGESKLKRYGEEFLATIRRHGSGSREVLPETVGTPTAEDSLSLFRLGMTVEQIAARRNLKPETIYTHLSQAIADGKAGVLEVTGLTVEEAKKIQAVWRALPEEQRGTAFKPLFDALGGRYSYGVLRCLRNAWD